MTQYEVKQIEKYRKDIKGWNVAEKFACSAAIMCGTLSILAFFKYSGIEAVLISSFTGLNSALNFKNMLTSISKKANLQKELAEIEGRYNDSFDSYQGGKSK